MATIIMSANEVIEAANNVINNIIAERTRRNEKSIKNVMDEKRGIFKKYYLTREQAIKYLQNSEDMFTGWKSIYAWGTLDKAKALLKLAQHGDPVTLDQDDINVLF